MAYTSGSYHGHVRNQLLGGGQRRKRGNGDGTMSVDLLHLAWWDTGTYHLCSLHSLSKTGTRVMKKGYRVQKRERESFPKKDFSWIQKLDKHFLGEASCSFPLSLTGLKHVDQLTFRQFNLKSVVRWSREKENINSHSNFS